MIVIILLITIVNCYSYNYVNYNKAYDIVNLKDTPCIISKKKKYDNSFVTGYTLNTNGCPIIPLKYDATFLRDNNLDVSMIFTKKQTSGKIKKLIFNGKLKKITGSKKEFNIIPDTENLIYKNKYLKENSNSHWIDNPFVDMYILYKISTILFIDDNNNIGKINVNSYKNNYIHYVLNLF